MIIEINGKDNKTLKLIRSLSKKKGRLDSGCYFAEGTRLVDEALKYAKDNIKFIITSKTFCEKNLLQINDLDEKGLTIYTSNDKLFNEVCDTETPQGIGAVLKIPDVSSSSVDDLSFILILDRISEPGNLGTIIRTAEAAGIDAIYMIKGCTDLYSPKVVRSTMGSMFRVPCITGVEFNEIKTLKANGFTLISTSLKDSQLMSEAKVSGKRALVIGNEAFGVSDEILEISDLKIRIPMEGNVESLNAAVAAGISMYFIKP